MNNDVGQERWQKAQEWEKSFWDQYVRKQQSIKKLAFLKTLAKKILRDGPGDDRNYWWAEKFEDYYFIPGKLENVLEVGCGPFTNLRIVLRKRYAKHVFASDPFSLHYVTYKGYQLAKKWKSRQWLIDDHPLEELPFADAYFDLVICINVLDHVRDPNLCMTNLIRVIKKGGILIFGQDLTTEDDVKATQSHREKTGMTIGHPHTFPSEEFFLPYLRAFEPMIQKVLPRDQGCVPRYNCGTFLFAGKRTALE